MQQHTLIEVTLYSSAGRQTRKWLQRIQPLLKSMCHDLPRDAVVELTMRGGAAGTGDIIVHGASPDKHKNDYEAFRIARERVAAHLYIPTGKIEVKIKHQR
jgi:hypothetical protein